ncbi:hypothetical protein E2P81_ATG06373 [Venturia nashicola]|nr:hypothetical protein E2P81_ATG06373 [Venturia nashicola]
MPQSGYYDPFGNWITNQAFHPYNNHNAFHQLQTRNNQGSGVSIDQSDESGTSLASLKTRYNKTQGQLSAMKDDNDVLKRENEKLKQENAELCGKDEGSAKLVPTKHRAKGALKSSSEAMKALGEAGVNKATEAKTNEGDEADSTEMEMVLEQEEKASDDNQVDYPQVVDPTPEDEIDWDFEDLHEDEEVVVREVEVVEEKASERKAGEDGEANVVGKKRMVSMDGKKPKRSRNRK